MSLLNLTLKKGIIWIYFLLHFMNYKSKLRKGILSTNLFIESIPFP